MADFFRPRFAFFICVIFLQRKEASKMAQKVAAKLDDYLKIEKIGRNHVVI